MSYETSTSKTTLYTTVLDSLADIGLDKQQQYIFDQISKEEKEEAKFWNELISLPNSTNFTMIKGKELRQDCMKNSNYGILADYNENDLWPIAPVISNKNYNCFDEANIKNYLNKCLLIAHSLNEKFQNDMNETFNDIIDDIDDIDDDESGIFQSGNVKLFQRCVTKAQSDYALKQFPSCASIIDYLRCSVTFNSAKDLVAACNAFKEKVKNNDAGCVVSILRIKNGFKKISNWKTYKDCQYTDLKASVLIANESRTRSIIGEVQFLLNWQLKAKKL